MEEPYGWGREAGELHEVRGDRDTGAGRGMVVQQLRSEWMTNQAAQHGVMVNCAHCGWSSVPIGPYGGYVCPQCFHTEEPPAVHTTPTASSGPETAADDEPETPAPH
ncbi:hypothetical protein E4198_00010 [Streptomyces sp. RKND-216]|uniref:hypothetical protein n=1 Tax=Streptomyces sp. RKND-216 TaxID=2562581 RepID=UPI00109E33FC|nr:hypothetical protein [Streptomyces sp. RKND-216]THA28234.1 hypothetical protein E4198_00010 [Streptomyces sp. RKND-216]